MKKIVAFLLLLVFFVCVGAETLEQALAAGGRIVNTAPPDVPKWEDCVDVDPAPDIPKWEEGVDVDPAPVLKIGAEVPKEELDGIKWDNPPSDRGYSDNEKAQPKKKYSPTFWITLEFAIFSVIAFSILFLLQKKMLFGWWSALTLLALIFPCLAFHHAFFGRSHFVIESFFCGLYLLIPVLVPGIIGNKFLFRVWKNCRNFLKIAFSKENYFRTCMLILAFIATTCLLVNTFRSCARESRIYVRY
ncbi:MAG: hypothetical protein MJ016_02295 [Victivallaceae bacterium]|nr:hypothetical protein [Victivallaceae bacterium]